MNLDDKARKKIMQKIRNRISAQESRDRKKNQFNELVNNNMSLVKNAMNLKKQVEELQRENTMLRMKKESESTTRSQQSCSRIERLKTLFAAKPGKQSRADWKPFSLFVLSLVIYTLLHPEQNLGDRISEEVARGKLDLIRSKEAISQTLVEKLEGLCNEFGKNMGLSCNFGFTEQLFGQPKTEPDILDFNSNSEEPASKPFDRTHVDLASELKRQFDAIVEESLAQGHFEAEDSLLWGSYEQEGTKSHSSESHSRDELDNDTDPHQHQRHVRLASHK